MRTDKLESRARALWHYFREKPIIRSVLERIERELPQDRYQYHNVFHAHEVAQEALFLALYEDKLNFWELELLAIAAAYHDAGYIIQYENNETCGAWMAVAAMRESGNLEERDILRVWNAIVGTQMSHDKFGRLTQLAVPGDPIVECLADADLGNLGRPDFWTRSENLFQEFLALGRLPDNSTAMRRKFKEISLSFMYDHSYYTRAAKELREPVKLANRAFLAANNLLAKSCEK